MNFSLSQSKRMRFFGFLFSLIIGYSLFLSLPAFANDDDTQYITGKVLEIISEKTMVDEAFHHQQKTIKFKVYFPDEPAEHNTLVIEQKYSMETPASLLPVQGRNYIFFKEAQVDGSTAYVLVDIKRTDHLYSLILLVFIVLFIFGRWPVLRSLFILGALVGSAFVFMPLGLSWSSLSLLTLLCGVAVASAFVFNAPHMGQRVKAIGLSTLISLLVTGVLIWLSGILSLGNTQSLLEGGFWMQVAPGFCVLIPGVVIAIQTKYKKEPESTAKNLFQHGIDEGRSLLSILTLLYGGVYSSQILSQLYAQGTPLTPLQMEPALGQLSFVFYILLGLVSSLFITSSLGTRLIHRKHI